MKFHIVKQGETMAKIAKQYGLDELSLYDMNKHLSEVTDVLEGMKVKVPQNTMPSRHYSKLNQDNADHSQARFPFPDHVVPRSIPVIREDEWFDKELVPYVNYDYNNAVNHSHGADQPAAVPFPYPHFYQDNPYNNSWSNGCGCQ